LIVLPSDSLELQRFASSLFEWSFSISSATLADSILKELSRIVLDKLLSSITQVVFENVRGYNRPAALVFAYVVERVPKPLVAFAIWHVGFVE
jgi:hypothetical protein